MVFILKNILIHPHIRHISFPIILLGGVFFESFVMFPPWALGGLLVLCFVLFYFLSTLLEPEVFVQPGAQGLPPSPPLAPAFSQNTAVGCRSQAPGLGAGQWPRVPEMLLLTEFHT